MDPPEPGLLIQTHRPAAGGAFLTMPDPAELPAGATLSVNQARHLLVFYPEDPALPEEVLVDRVGTMDMLAWAPLGPTRLAVGLPVHLAYGAQGAGGQPALGDLALDLTFPVTRRHDSPVGVALHGRGTIPTGAEEAWLGEGRPTFSAAVAAATGRTWTVGATMGVASGSGGTLGEISWGERFTWAAGAAVPAGPVHLQSEIRGAALLSHPTTPGAHPVELLGAVASRSSPLSASIGVGAGLTGGVGAPSLRLLGTVTFSGSGMGTGRGVATSTDLCPLQQQDGGCPDQGVVPVLFSIHGEGGAAMEADVTLTPEGHGAPEVILPVARAWTGHSLPPGPWRAEVEAPGYASLPINLFVPMGPPIRVQARLSATATERGATSGDISPDRDGDGIPDLVDRCPDQPEDRDGHRDDDGCPDSYLTTTIFRFKDSDGRPVPGSELALVRGTMSGRWTSSTPTIYRSLVPGRYRITAQAPGHGPVEAEVEIPTGRLHDVEVTLPAAEASALLSVFPGDPAGYPLESRVAVDGPPSLLLPEVTSGKAVFTLPAGTWTVTASAAGYSRRHVIVELEEGARETVQIALGPLEKTEGAPAGGGEEPLLEPIALREIPVPPLGGTATMLSGVADLLAARPDLLAVRVEGWAGPGDPAEESRRSLVVAQAAAEWLVRHGGVEPHRIKVVGMGSHHHGDRIRVMPAAWLVPAGGGGR